MSIFGPSDHVKVLAPNTLVGKRLYLADGRTLVIESQKGILFERKLLTEDPLFWTDLENQTIKQTIGLAEQTITDEINATIPHFVESGKTAIEPLTKAALQALRRKLIESSSGQLKLLFQEFFNRNQKDITEVFSAEKTDGVIKSSGLIPKLVRFKWVMKKNNTQFSIYCLEMPPQRRHLNIKKSDSTSHNRYAWAIPWLCILAIFKDNQFIKLTAFYRNGPLDAEDNGLLKCGLPGKYNNVPWTYCDNQSCPDIQLSDPGWVDKLLIWFFDSIFVYHEKYHNYDIEFGHIRKAVPQFITFSDWEKFSNGSDYMRKVCNINFPAAPMNLFECVVKIFEYYSKAEVQKSPETVKKKEFAALAEKFEQATREKFVFLVGKIAIDPETGAKINSFFMEALNSLKKKLTANLSNRLASIGDIIKQKLIGQIQPPKKEGV